MPLTFTLDGTTWTMHTSVSATFSGKRRGNKDRVRVKVDRVHNPPPLRITTKRRTRNHR